MIAIIDYGLGNVKAFANVYDRLNIPAMIARQDKDLQNVDKVILPGVGAFDYAMQRLEKSGMRQMLDEIVLRKKAPVLGICVGMQMLACSSEEGCLPGLGWIDGVVKRFNPSSLKHSMYVPHMGWNDVKAIKNNSLLKGLDHNARFYFLHSYYFQCHRTDDVIAVTDYGGEFACAVNSGNVFGVQFHPEKSHQWGVQLLKNFAEM
jgi:imidazole glycerol-phosphate synthase subunit HisH